METLRSPEYPKLVERGNPYGKNLSFYTIFINFNVVKLDEEDEEGNLYEFNRVELKTGQFTHDGVVNAIITAKYPQDKMEAITNNYIAENDIEALVAAVRTAKSIAALKTAVIGTLGNRDVNIVTTYNEMQSWRRMAKDVAATVFDSDEKTVSNLLTDRYCDI